MARTGWGVEGVGGAGVWFGIWEGLVSYMHGLSKGSHIDSSTNGMVLSPPTPGYSMPFIDPA
jgi:hypothetical protein